MKTPFPGMDPYLEYPSLWKEIHHDLIGEIRHFLIPRLRPKYRVAIEQMTYLSVMPPSNRGIGVPDVLVTSPKPTNGPTMPLSSFPQIQEMHGGTLVKVKPIMAELPMPEIIKHKYLEVRHQESHEVVTIIEILSPANKTNATGREKYNDKRFNILGSYTHLVEIDLLRIGKPMTMSLAQKSDYRLIVSRAHKRPMAEIYLFGVRHAIPDLPIPLYPGDPEPVLPLNTILHDLYVAGGYDMVINYQKPPTPVLSDEDEKWRQQLLKKT
ncbi:MAG: hypothetical protein B6242_05760 [Anaerolineaceae bacterium 4572_78]|nr:MAG: hypothetical protein B6242_05760 [Anaerolineaceae bacterium 4572_78]